MEHHFISHTFSSLKIVLADLSLFKAQKILTQIFFKQEIFNFQIFLGPKNIEFLKLIWK